MDSLQMSNDARGWIMCVVSGIACVAGASIICVDILIRKIPSKKNFRIQDSDVFLACSLSLSFGVMLFSALVGMLPSSKNYLNRGGFSPSAAEWTRLGCFVAGFIGIQVISRFLHRFIPSQVVDCDHTHDASPPDSRHTTRANSQGAHDRNRRHSNNAKPGAQRNDKDSEETPLLSGNSQHADGRSRSKSVRRATSRNSGLANNQHQSVPPSRRPSMMQVHSRVMSFVKDTKENCDEGGPCFGYSDPCSQECVKHVGISSPLGPRRQTIHRVSTGGFPNRTALAVPEIPEEGEEVCGFDSTTSGTSSHTSRTRSEERAEAITESEDDDLEAQHHHHVPKNAFMSIGLQTSIAIALHKLPEGFITYATNHANPTLGFTVFMALFIHNITEGFAMALPLYLALGNRFRAMFWSSLLGGFSQPLGAGVAAMWFHLAKSTDHLPGYAVYGCMFAVTAGIMASVALALFVESLSVNHNSQLCIGSALVGMSILGISNALTA